MERAQTDEVYQTGVGDPGVGQIEALEIGERRDRRQTGVVDRGVGQVEIPMCSSRTSSAIRVDAGSKGTAPPSVVV